MTNKEMDKVYDEICKKNNITREQWDNMEEWKKLNLICPNGIWHKEEDEIEEDSMDKADSWYDEQQDRLASENCK